MKKRQTILPFDIAPAQEALTAHGGLILPYETAQALNLPRVIDRELPAPGQRSGVLMKNSVLFPWYRTSTIATVRWKLYQTAGMVTSHARRVTLKLAASVDKIAQFCLFRRKCFRMATG